MQDDPGIQHQDEPHTPHPDAPDGPSQDECRMGLIVHALGISSSFVGPLIIWRTKGQDSAFVNQQAKEALNFQITLAVILLACWNFAPAEWFPILLSGYLALNTILSIPAIIAASKGKPFRYRLPVRLIE